jgi:hypothetical protein
MSTDEQRQLLSYLSSIQQQQQQSAPSTSQYMPMTQQAPNLSFDPNQYGAFSIPQPTANAGPRLQARQQPTLAPAPNPFGLPQQPQMGQREQQHMAIMRNQIAASNQAASMGGHGGQAGQAQIQQLLNFVQQNQSQGQPSLPFMAPPTSQAQQQQQRSSFAPGPSASQPQTQQQISASILQDMMAGGKGLSPEQANTLAYLNMQRRGGAPPGLLPQVAQQPAFPMQNMYNKPQPLAPSTAAQVGAEQGAALLQLFQKQSQLRGLTIRKQKIEAALREGVHLPRPGVEVESAPQPLDAKDRANYETQLALDARAIANVTEEVQSFVRNNGGQEGVAALVQTHRAMLASSGIGGMVGGTPAMQQQGFVAQPHQQPQQQRPQVPLRPPSSAAQQPRAPSPSVVPLSLPPQQRYSAEHVQRLYQAFGIAATMFDRAWADLQAKGAVPLLQQKPVINGREINIFDLLRLVLSAGGCENVRVCAEIGRAMLIVKTARCQASLADDRPQPGPV